MPNGDDPSERLDTGKTLADFSHALSKHLPRRLSQLREIGRETRALSGRRPKKRS